MRLFRTLHFNIGIPAESVSRMIDAAATPSTQRLHMRETFAEGRRYHLEPIAGGFRMATTSRTLFVRGRRTSVLSVLYASVDSIGEAEARITLEARLRWIALAGALVVPTILTLLLIPVPWPPLLIALICAIAFVASVVAVVSGAKLEAYEMLYFVDKTFEDVRKFSLAQLAPVSQDIIGAQDFRALWSEHIRSHAEEQ